MFKNIINFILINLILFVGTSKAQEIYFKKISEQLELPSQECYNVIQDSKGYIWICTENGVVKYSKGHTKIFNKLNGLPENSAYFISENLKGEIELITSDNRILKIVNDDVIPMEYTEKFQNLIKKNSSPKSFDLAYLKTIKSNNEIIVTTQQRTYQISEVTKNISDLTRNYKSNKEPYIKLYLSDIHSYFIKANTKAGHKISETNNTIELELNSGPNKKVIPIKLSANARLDWRSRIRTLNGVTFFSLHNLLLCIDKNLNVKTISYPSVITSIYTDSKHGLWVGTSSFGVYHYPNINNLEDYNQGLSGLTVSSIFVDCEGGTWCTTTEKGVYYTANYNISYFPEIKEFSKKTKLLKTVGKKLFFSTEIDKLLYLENNRIFQVKLPETGNNDITDIMSHKGKIYLASKGYFGVLNNDFNSVKVILYPFNPKYNITTYQLDKTATNLYVLGIGTVYRLKDNNLEILTPHLISKARCFKAVNDSVLYIGCNNGLYKLNCEKHTIKKIRGINTAVSKIIRSKKGNYYFTTKGQGLYKIKNDLPIPIILDSKSLMLNDIVQDEFSNIWISSNDGLICFNENDSKIKFNKYNTSDGILSNDIGQLSIYNHNIYMSTPEGVCKFPVSTTLLNFKSPTLILRQIKINGSVILNKQLIGLKYWENTLSFTFDQINYKLGGEECVSFKLIGQTDHFETTQSNTLNFENLPPNDYELIVYAINNNGVKSEKPFTIKFKIYPPFWQTLWFSLIIILSGILIIGFIIAQISKRIKVREEENTKVNKLISESHLRALQAQMNPHFIFNAINSIQNYILNKQDEDAYNYLTKFSKLVRLVLNNSREKEVNLQSEIEVLQLYIEIEQLRFGNNFESFINLADEINPYEIEIPTMLIQPYVENAIWHGLMNLNNSRKGYLKIDISKNSDLLIIIVEDNGVGRKKASEFKLNGFHHSIGMQLTEERLNIINLLWDTKNVKVVIKDLYNENNEACGTRIELFLPLNEGI